MKHSCTTKKAFDLASNYTLNTRIYFYHTTTGDEWKKRNKRNMEIWDT